MTTSILKQESQERLRNHNAIIMLFQSLHTILKHLFRERSQLKSRPDNLILNLFRELRMSLHGNVPILAIHALVLAYRC